jgi:hypothetical protein
MVPVDGLEPSHPKAGDFESPVSTNSTTLAQISSAIISDVSLIAIDEDDNSINNPD